MTLSNGYVSDLQIGDEKVTVIESPGGYIPVIQPVGPIYNDRRVATL